jgi:hypothetical protein
VQLAAAGGIGRLAGYSDDLAAEVVRLGILPHLVRFCLGVIRLRNNARRI